jgi:hypothetical protein
LHTSNDGPVSDRLNGAAAGNAPVRPAAAYRAASARPVAAAIWILAACTLGWLLMSGDADAAIHATPWLYLASWGVYVSWGAPNPPTAFGSGLQHASDLKSHPFSILPSNERISQPETRTGRDAIAAAWRDARAAGTATVGNGVVSTWNMPTIVAGAAAVLAVTLAALA